MRQETETSERCSLEVRRGHDTLLVGFCSGKFRPGRYELRELCDELPADYLILGDPTRMMALEGIPGVAASRPELDDWIAERAARYRRVIVFGTSIGGTMASQCAERIGAALSIGVSPLSGYRGGDISRMTSLPGFASQLDRIERILTGDDGRAELARYARMADFGWREDGATRHIALSATSDIGDRLHAWRLAQIAAFRVFEIPDVMHPGLGYLMRRGHLPDLLALAVAAGDPALTCLDYCDRYFRTCQQPESTALALLRKARRARRRREEMAKVLAEGGDSRRSRFYSRSERP